MAEVRVVLERDIDIAATRTQAGLVIAAATPANITLRERSADSYLATLAPGGRGTFSGMLDVTQVGPQESRISVRLEFRHNLGGGWGGEPTAAEIERSRAAVMSTLTVIATDLERVFRDVNALINETGRVTVDGRADQVIERVRPEAVTAALRRVVQVVPDGPDLVSRRAIAQGWLVHRFRVEAAGSGTRVLAVTEVEMPAAGATAPKALELRAQIQGSAAANLERLTSRLGVGSNGRSVA